MEPLLNNSRPILAPISWRILFRTDKMRLDSSVYFYEVLEDSKIEISELYTISKKGLVIFQSVGNWTTLDGYFNTPIVPKWERRMNLMGIQLKCSIVEYTNLAEYYNSSTNPEQPWTGGFIDIISILGQKLNFSVEYVESVDGFWGSYVNDTLEWNGMVGICLLYTSPSPRDKRQSRMPSSA